MQAVHCPFILTTKTVDTPETTFVVDMSCKSINACKHSVWNWLRLQTRLTRQSRLNENKGHGVKIKINLLLKALIWNLDQYVILKWDQTEHAGWEYEEDV